MADANKNSFRDNALRVIAIIGLIAVLLLGAWGIIQLAFYIPTLFSGSSGSAAETVTVSVNSPVTSGQNLNVSWRHLNGKGNYSYTVSYSCVEGLIMKAPTPSGSSQDVPCNTPFNFTSAQTGMSVETALTGSKAAQVAFTVSAVNLADGKTTATGSASATVNPSSTAAKPTTTTTKKPTTSKTTYTAAPAPATLYGYGDLSGRILSVSPSNAGGYVTVQFEVTNLGTNTIPAGWSFNALLPISQPYSYSYGYSNSSQYTYPSGPQRALNPGDKIVFNLGFQAGFGYNQNTYGNCYTYNGYANYPAPCNVSTNPYPQGYTSPGYNYGYNGYGYYPNYGTTGRSVSINLDPYNQVWEQNEANNIVTAQVY